VEDEAVDPVSRFSFLYLLSKSRRPRSSSSISDHDRVPTFRATTNEIYDLAWSPDGAHIIVGSTDNTARIYDATTGSFCL
jgi:WD40 repeat protein